MSPEDADAAQAADAPRSAADPAAGGETFRLGDPIEFLQMGKPPYLTRLKAGGTANVRGHRFPHEALVGRPVGGAVRSPQGQTFFLVRPTLARWVELLPRFAKTIEPKEAGPILLYADIFPSARVLEAGFGSAGLTLPLLRAVGPTGEVISYDTRARSIDTGRTNVKQWFGAAPSNHTIRERDVYEGIDEGPLDRIVLDLPEPWQVVPHARAALRPGGLLAAFTPTVMQVHELTNALKDTGACPDVKTYETLQRTWHVGRKSVRPETGAGPHTGFVTVVRFVAPEPVGEL